MSSPLRNGQGKTDRTDKIILRGTFKRFTRVVWTKMCLRAWLTTWFYHLLWGSTYPFKCLSLLFRSFFYDMTLWSVYMCTFCQFLGASLSANSFPDYWCGAVFWSWCALSAKFFARYRKTNRHTSGIIYILDVTIFTANIEIDIVNYWQFNEILNNLFGLGLTAKN